MSTETTSIPDLTDPDALRAAILNAVHHGMKRSAPTAATRPPSEVITDTLWPLVTEAASQATAPAERQAGELWRALSTLVALKDGPRDEVYRATKDAAWQDARIVLKALNTDLLR